MTTAAFPTGKVPGQDAVMECFLFFLTPSLTKVEWVYIYIYIQTYIHSSQKSRSNSRSFFSNARRFFFEQQVEESLDAVYTFVSLCRKPGR